MCAHSLHATCVSIAEHGVLFLGDSGAGKSDLALRLIDRGAKLVADDKVELSRRGSKIIASAPPSGKGLLEISKLGILKIPFKPKAALTLAVQLITAKSIERLPVPEKFECFDLTIPQIRLYAFEISAAIKVEMALQALQDNSMMVGAFKK